MKVTIQQIQRGLTNYIEAEIGSKAVGKAKFLTFFFAPQISNEVGKFIVNNKDNIMMKEFIDESGNVDLDKIYNQAKEAARKSGQIEMYGIVFNETDLDKLYNYIKQTMI